VLSHINEENHIFYLFIPAIKVTNMDTIVIGGDTMRNENRNNEQCRNEKDKKNLEFACELSNVEQCRNEKDCGGGCGGKR
jgi:hypothetical protein